MKMMLAGLAIVAAVVGGGIGYAGMKTAALPDWYDRETSSTPSAQSGAPASEVAGQTSERQANSVIEVTPAANPEIFADGADASPVSPEASRASVSAPEDVVISERELNALVTEAIANEPYAAPILDAAQGINTTIADGRIESGVVLNLSDIPREALPAEGQQAVDQITQTFPFLNNREVYLGIEGSPTVVDGALSLDDTHIKFGQLKLPVSKVAGQLGLSQADIEQQLGQVLEQQGLTPEDIQVVDGQILIKGIAQ